MIQKIEYSHSEYVMDVLNVKDLNIDTSYQRGERGGIKKMIKNFNPDLLEVISVNLRDDNKYYVIDGQQRVAACKIVGYEKLFAKVFIGLTVAEEAEIYVKINKGRTYVTAIETFKAKLRHGDKIAVELNNIFKENGYKVSQSPKGEPKPYVINSISQFEKTYQLTGYDRWYIDTILTAVTTAWNGENSGLTQYMVRGFYAFLKRYKDEVKIERFHTALKKTTPQQLRANGQKYQELFAGSAEIAVAIGIWKEYNSGLRSNRLSEWR